MDGVLVIDKPTGLTSHDVVAVARRALGEKRIGHAGTLDPLATGVLVLAAGRATRLVRFLSASDKDYEATIRFGLVTDSYDITGNTLEQSEARPDRRAVEQAIASLGGEYLQTPPPYSAKKVDGHRAYALARRDEPVVLTPAPVRVTGADVIAFSGASVTVAITCSAGFYVRSFAHALGQLVGTGACVEALRRTRSGDFRVEEALPLEALSDPAARETVARSIIPMGRLMPAFPAVCVTNQGRAHVSHGRELSADDYVLSGGDPGSGIGDPGAKLDSQWVRVLDAEGGLLALARPGTAHGSLHPSVVLI